MDTDPSARASGVPGNRMLLIPGAVLVVAGLSALVFHLQESGPAPRDPDNLLATQTGRADDPARADAPTAGSASVASDRPAAAVPDDVQLLGGKVSEPADADELDAELEEDDDDEAKIERPKPRAPKKPELALDEPLPKGASVLRDGRTIFHPAAGQIIMPGEICQNDVPIEYFACFEGGKDHESVIVVKSDPMMVMAGLMMLNLRRGKMGGLERDEVPKGDPLRLYIEWKEKDGKIKRVRAEELILQSRNGDPMPQTPWMYTGSRTLKDPESGRTIFMAALDGVLAAVYRDANAIINNPLPESADDTSYTINAKVCPPIGTKVRLVLEKAPRKEWDALIERLKNAAAVAPAAKPDK